MHVPTTAPQTLPNSSSNSTNTLPIVPLVNPQQISNSNESSRDEDDGIAALSSRMSDIHLQIGATIPPQPSNYSDDQLHQRPSQRGNDTLGQGMDLPSPTSRIIHGHSEQSRSLGNVRAINPPPPIQLPLQARDRH